MKSDHRIEIDRSKTLAEEPSVGHNRWHPDISAVISVPVGEVIAIETRDAFDGQISERTDAAGVARCNLDLVHPLTGPVYVEGAEPGDILEVKVHEVAPEPFGYTVQVPGFGFLRDEFTEPFIVRWRIENGAATSIDLPGVRIPGAPFMGVIGNAPSNALLEEIHERESDLLERDGAVLLPDPSCAVPADDAIANTAMRTVAPHECGGNLDIKQLTAGTTVRIPVYVPGALFSVGDAHFAQGDNESCGTAVEMGATFYGSFALRKGEARGRTIRDIQFYCDDYFAPAEHAVPKRFFATTGQSTSRDGRAYSEDVTIAARNALLNMIDHIVAEYRLSPQQAYAICSVAVDLRIAELVDVPNMVVTAFLPLHIFDADGA